MLAQCLASAGMTDLTYISSVEIIIVDDASTDGTAQMLRTTPRITIVANSTNSGFARSCNRGASTANGEVLIFLNNDTLPKIGWLSPLVHCLMDSSNGVAGSVLFYPDGSVQHAGVHFDSGGIPHNQRLVAPKVTAIPYRLQAVTGACLAIRRADFHGAGGFDEQFRNSFEDIDLCLRLRRMDLGVMLVPASQLVHLESQSLGRHLHDHANRELFTGRWGLSPLPDVHYVKAKAAGNTRPLSVLTSSSLPGRLALLPESQKLRAPIAIEWISYFGHWDDGPNLRLAMETECSGESILVVDDRVTLSTRLLSYISTCQDTIVRVTGQDGAAAGVAFPRRILEDLTVETSSTVSSLLLESAAAGRTITTYATAE